MKNTYQKMNKDVDINLVITGGGGGGKDSGLAYTSGGGGGGIGSGLGCTVGGVDIKIPTNGDVKMFHLKGLRLYVKYEKGEVIFCDKEGNRK